MPVCKGSLELSPFVNPARLLMQVMLKLVRRWDSVTWVYIEPMGYHGGWDQLVQAMR